MSLAPYSNDQVNHQNLMNQDNDLSLLLGSFREKDTDNIFEYGLRAPIFGDFAPELEYSIWTSDGPRLATVKKTVVYVAIDEDVNGVPVLEKWNVKSHNFYDTDWVAT